MPTMINHKTGETHEVDINKPQTQDIRVTTVSKDNPEGESPMAVVDNPPQPPQPHEPEPSGPDPIEPPPPQEPQEPQEPAPETPHHQP